MQQLIEEVKQLVPIWTEGVLGCTGWILNMIFGQGWEIPVFFCLSWLFKSRQMDFG